jgi:predicted small integral membrane protein
MTLVTMAATEVLETGTVVLIGILAAVTARGDRDTEALVRCAVEVLGYVPESVAALTDEKSS